MALGPMAPALGEDAKLFQVRNFMFDVNPLGGLLPVVVFFMHHQRARLWFLYRNVTFRSQVTSVAFLFNFYDDSIRAAAKRLTLVIQAFVVHVARDGFRDGLDYPVLIDVNLCLDRLLIFLARKLFSFPSLRRLFGGIDDDSPELLVC